MSNIKSVLTRGLFLTEWSILNILGWAVGFIVVQRIIDNLYFLKYHAWKYGLANDFRKSWMLETLLIWLPLGLFLGTTQWLLLRRFKISLLSWSTATGLGVGIFITLYFWLHDFVAYDLAVPSWFVTGGQIAAILIGGMIFSGLQTAILRNYLSQPADWMKSYILGLLITIAVIPIEKVQNSALIFFIQGFGIDTDNFFTNLYVTLMIVAALSISIQTGNVLYKLSRKEFSVSV